MLLRAGAIARHMNWVATLRLGRLPRTPHELAISVLDAKTMRPSRDRISMLLILSIWDPICYR